MHELAGSSYGNSLIDSILTRGASYRADILVMLNRGQRRLTVRYFRPGVVHGIADSFAGQH